jgi:hypothetical protein
VSLVPSAVPSVAAGPTACDHPYWPLRLGSTWTLGSKDQNVTSTIVEVTGDATTATAKYRTQNANGSTYTSEIRCSAAEGLAYGDAVFVAADGHVGTKTTGTIEGPQLPPVSGLKDGATFINRSTSDLDFPQYDASGTYTGHTLYQLVIDQTCTVHGPRNIKVAAGKFNGFEITCKGTSTRKVAVEPDSVVDYDTDAYWLEGVGFSGVADNAQLLRYSIPPLP